MRWPRVLIFLASASEEVRHRAAVERIIELVELERYRHATVAGLPFGIQKIVGFARVRRLEPALMLLDALRRLKPRRA